MAIPLQCPRSKTGSCIGNKCPMYILEWRSKEEYCIIGYYPASERKSRGKPIIDDYARGILGETKTRITPAAVLLDQKHTINKPVINPKTEPKLKNKDQKINKTRNMMNMEDIPDDYEKEFWDQQ